ncbi:MAG TPA: lysophospholipid acyltransferase family protein [Pyrinomonadaceae bacterium]|nr:lysophospholipid acyltransferase family protein [Pyrinomonadaceae bacterium]
MEIEETVKETQVVKDEGPTETAAQSLQLKDQRSKIKDPTSEEVSVLSRIERFAFFQAHEMNQGRWKRIWTWCQRQIGSRWIQVATYNLMNVYGLEHFEAADQRRPLVLVANHRSFFDMYAVSSVLFRRTRRPMQLFFPVRARFFYESLLGVLINFLAGWWSMYPPIFAEENPEKREFDKFSVRRLTDLCREGRGHVIGFHPEGTRNLGPDPYSYLRAQPGIGKIIKEAKPQVIPVFIAGLGNKAFKQISGNWRGGEPVRIHFGPQIELSEFYAKGDRLRTYKEIADFVMSKVAELGEKDREMYAKT